MTSAAPPTRINFATFAIPVGLSGLAGAWGVGTADLGIPAAVTESFWAIAAASWAWVIAAHTVRGYQSPEQFVDQLRHPAQGPLAALLPVAGMLLGLHLTEYLPVAGQILVIAGIAASTLFAGWILSYWASGRISLGSVHGGYLLPTVAAGYVAATAASSIGLTAVAAGAFAVATLFWLVTLTMVFIRLMTAPPLPKALVPSLVIIVAPPAVGGIAWFSMNDGRADVVAQVLAALLVLFTVMQFGLLPQYTRLVFSIGFWSFTFPIAATARYAMEWLGITKPAGWQAVDVILLAVTTVVIGAIGAFSVIRSADARRGRNAPAVPAGPASVEA